MKKRILKSMLKHRSSVEERLQVHLLGLPFIKQQSELQLSACEKSPFILFKQNSANYISMHKYFSQTKVPNFDKRLSQVEEQQEEY